MTEYTFSLESINPLELFGVNNLRLRQIQHEFPNVKFIARGDELKVQGEEEKLKRLKQILDVIFQEVKRKGAISELRFHEVLQPKQEMEEPEVQMTEAELIALGEQTVVYGNGGKVIKPKTAGQRKMVAAAAKNAVVFAVGPAGTGKTYMAVALAVKALKEKQVKKIVLSRPAVDAGESLGFLPGDMKEKIDPYLRPLYDALEDMIHSEKLKFYSTKNIIEIVPLAYMRGRTLSNAFIILDEAQNTTEMQMKMFLTRLGEHSRMIITGDDSQIDLPPRQKSGLVQSIKILKNIRGIGIVRMKATEMVRHKLVKKILKAYDKVYEQNK